MLTATRFSPQQPQTTPRLFLARYPAYLAVITVLLAMLLHGAVAAAEERAVPGDGDVATAPDVALRMAQPAPGGLPVKKERDLNLEPYLSAVETIPVAAFAGAADLWSTEHALRLRPGLIEKNIFGQNMGERAALTFVHLGVHTWCAHLVDRRFGRKWGRVALYGVSAAKLAVAANNYRLGKRGFQ